MKLMLSVLFVITLVAAAPKPDETLVESSNKATQLLPTSSD
jgi:hypothetical protein